MAHEHTREKRHIAYSRTFSQNRNNMRKQETSHWSNLNSLEGLLFFAQLVDEMLFDYTLDSYKPLALNSRLLCIESLETIEEIRNGFVPAKNLQSVLEELKWSLKKDLAAKELLGNRYLYFIEQIKPNDIKLNETENIVSLIYNYFNSRKYLDQIIKSLTELILDGRNKEKINYLTSAYLTELTNYGYNPNHIYYQNNNFFFNPTKRTTIKGIKDLDDFFSIFDFKEHLFTVIFKGGIIFRDFRDTLNNFNIVVTRTYNCFSTLRDDIQFEKTRKGNESFIICSKVEDLDHHAASEKAESLIGQICSLFNFYHHKEKPEILEKCVVQRNSDNFVVIIDKPTKPILKIKSDKSKYAAAKLVDETRNNIELEPESLHRFVRSIDLHSAALSSNTMENQLLDLWAAVETLLPKNTESNKDRIVQICDSLVPFLQLNYIHKLLNELYTDLKIWNNRIIDKKLAEIPDSSIMSVSEKMGALVTLDTTKSLRTELYDKLSDHPLLKNRLYTLHESLSGINNIEKLLISHKTKINWHLRRIYRTRGLIIHSGKKPSYTSTLIENLHNYLDLFLERLIELSISGNVTTIEQGVLETDLTLKYQLGLLEKHKNEKLTIDNFKEALLGEKK